MILRCIKPAMDSTDWTQDLNVGQQLPLHADNEIQELASPKQPPQQSNPHLRVQIPSQESSQQHIQASPTPPKSKRKGRKPQDLVQTPNSQNTNGQLSPFSSVSSLGKKFSPLPSKETLQAGKPEKQGPNAPSNKVWPFAPLPQNVVYEERASSSVIMVKAGASYRLVRQHSETVQSTYLGCITVAEDALTDKGQKQWVLFQRFVLFPISIIFSLEVIPALVLFFQPTELSHEQRRDLVLLVLLGVFLLFVNFYTLRLNYFNMRANRLWLWLKVAMIALFAGSLVKDLFFTTQLSTSKLVASFSTMVMCVQCIALVVQNDIPTHEVHGKKKSRLVFFAQSLLGTEAIFESIVAGNAKVKGRHWEPYVVMVLLMPPFILWSLRCLNSSFRPSRALLIWCLTFEAMSISLLVENIVLLDHKLFSKISVVVSVSHNIVELFLEVWHMRHSGEGW